MEEAVDSSSAAHSPTTTAAAGCVSMPLALAMKSLVLRLLLCAVAVQRDGQQAVGAAAKQGEVRREESVSQVRRRCADAADPMGGWEASATQYCA